MSLWRNKFVLLLQNTSYETTVLSIVSMYFVIILFIMTFLYARDGKIRHFRKLNENAGDSDNVNDELVANHKGDHEMLSRKF